MAGRTGPIEGRRDVRLTRRVRRHVERGTHLTGRHRDGRRDRRDTAGGTAEGDDRIGRLSGIERDSQLPAPALSDAEGRRDEATDGGGSTHHPNSAGDGLAIEGDFELGGAGAHPRDRDGDHSLSDADGDATGDCSHIGRSTDHRQGRRLERNWEQQGEDRAGRSGLDGFRIRQQHDRLRRRQGDRDAKTAGPSEGIVIGTDSRHAGFSATGRIAGRGPHAGGNPKREGLRHGIKLGRRDAAQREADVLGGTGGGGQGTHAARQAGTQDLPVDQHVDQHIDFAADIPAALEAHPQVRRRERRQGRFAIDPGGRGPCTHGHPGIAPTECEAGGVLGLGCEAERWNEVRRQGRGIGGPPAPMQISIERDRRGLCEDRGDREQDGTQKGQAPRPDDAIHHAGSNTRVGHRRSFVSGEQQQVVREAREERAYVALTNTASGFWRTDSCFWRVQKRLGTSGGVLGPFGPNANPVHPGTGPPRPSRATDVHRHA